MVRKASKYLDNSFQYIAHYAKSVALRPVKACIEVMGAVKKILEVILKGEEVQAALASTPLIKGINE
jgi:thiaminase